MQKEIYESREDLQAAAITNWVKSGKVGTIDVPTGTGKMYLGIVAACGQIKKGLIKSCLIVVPTVNLIEQWKEEIIKWEYTLDGITIKCLQSAYKEKSVYDLLIVDEVHTATGEQYSKIFENAKHIQCLGLSATVDPENAIIKKYCPVIFKVTIRQALGAKTFNEYKVYNVEVGMTKKEKATYDTFDRQFKLSRLQLLIIKRDYPEYRDLTIFDIARMNSKSKDKTDLVKYSRMFWSAMSLRKSVCYNTWSKALVAADLVNSNPNDKWIVFTMSIDLATQLSEIIPNSKVYHSKQKNVERAKILQEYSNNKFNCIVTVQALDAGLNVPNIDKAIAVSGVSTELTAVQRLGRIARIKPIASMFINLYSKDTIEKSWVEKRNRSIDNVEWITFSSLKNILKDGSR